MCDVRSSGGQDRHADSSGTVWVGVYVTAVVLFTATWAVLGNLNDGYVLFDTVVTTYSAVSQPISGLGLGSTAAAMNTAFIAYGAIAMVSATGVGRLVRSVEPRAAGTVRLTFTLHGVGSVLVGVFTLEHMPLHSLGFLLVLAPIAGFVVVGRRSEGRNALSRLAHWLLRLAAPVSVLLLVAFFASFDPDAAGDNRGVAGLTQRLLILHVQGWTAATGIAAARAERQLDVTAKR